MELAIVLALILLVAASAAWVGLQYDSPNTRDSLKIRLRGLKD